MKIKLDENMPESLVALFQELGHDADTVRSEGLGGAMDPDVWTAAQVEERFFVTQDLDFSDVRQFVPGTHHGLLLVRLHEAGRRALHGRVQAAFLAENVEDLAGLLCRLERSQVASIEAGNRNESWQTIRQ